MNIELSLKKSCNELEKALNPSYFDCIEVYEPIGNIESGGVVFIITKDEPQYITSATWAYGDKELESILKEGNQMKCIIIVDSVRHRNVEIIFSEEIIGIIGLCVDNGGENYIAYPLLTSEGTEEEKLQFCMSQDIQGYLSGNYIKFKDKQSKNGRS